MENSLIIVNFFCSFLGIPHMTSMFSLVVDKELKKHSEKPFYGNKQRVDGITKELFLNDDLNLKNGEHTLYSQALAWAFSLGWVLPQPPTQRASQGKTWQ